jgi:O-antigen/teichoic acid export membrane protein
MRHWFNDQHFRSLLKNASYLAISKGVAAVASIGTLAFTGRALGLEGFGLLILIASYAQAANGLVKFQSWQLVVRYGGAALARDNTDDFKRAASFSLGLDLLSGLVGMCLAMVLLPLIGGWFGLEDRYLGLALVYCLLIPTMGASSPTGMMRSMDRFDLISWQGVVTPISRSILTGIGFWQGWSFSAFVAIWFVTDLAGDLYLWFLTWRELRRRRLGTGIRPTLRTTGLKNAWPFAIQTNLTYSLESAWGPLARLIVGGLLGPAAAAVYRVASSLADSARKPADLLAKAYYPEVVRMDAATKHPWRLMLRGTALAGAFGLVGVLILVVGGRPLIQSLFGAEFLGVYPVLLIMMAIPLIAVLSFPLIPMLLTLDRPDAPLKGRLVGTLVYFAVVAPLSWRFGVQGAAVAIVLGYVAMAVVLIWYLRKEHRRVRGR